MSAKPRKRANPLYTLAATIVSAIASIATSATKAVAVPLGCVAAILLVFTLMLWYETRRGGGGSNNSGTGQPRKLLDLHPDRLAATLDAGQRDYLELALRGAATDVASVVQMPSTKVRANLFALKPGGNKLCMVKDLWHNMNDPKEHTIEVEIGRGSTGLAWDSRDLNKAVWKEGWGDSDLRNEKELRKVNPELRWILSVPIFGSEGPETKLVLNVDGLSRTPSDAALSKALTHLPRFGQGISRRLGL
jgi:hypothetical protein